MVCIITIFDNFLEMGNLMLFPISMTDAGLERTLGKSSDLIESHYRIPFNKVSKKEYSSEIKTYAMDSLQSEPRTTTVQYHKINIRETFPGFIPASYFSDDSRVIILSQDKRQIVTISVEMYDFSIIKYHRNVTKISSSPISSNFAVLLEGNKVMLNGTNHEKFFDDIPIKHISCSSSSYCFISEKEKLYSIGSPYNNEISIDEPNGFPYKIIGNVKKVKFPFKKMNVKVECVKSGFFSNVFMLSDETVYG